MTTLAPAPSLTHVSTHTQRHQRDHLRAAIARLGGHRDWRVDSSGWVVTLHLPEERTFVGPRLEAALAACVARLMPPVVPSPRAVGPTSR